MQGELLRGKGRCGTGREHGGTLTAAPVLEVVKTLRLKEPTAPPDPLQGRRFGLTNGVGLVPHLTFSAA